MPAFASRPHLVPGARKYPLAQDAQAETPVPCDFKLGEKVTYTNCNGVEFFDKVITGFAPSVTNRRFVYLDKDSWWFPVDPAHLSRPVSVTESA
jgi:hypothetical protein